MRLDGVEDGETVGVEVESDVLEAAMATADVARDDDGGEEEAVAVEGSDEVVVAEEVDSVTVVHEVGAEGVEVAVAIADCVVADEGTISGGCESEIVCTGWFEGEAGGIPLEPATD